MAKKSTAKKKSKAKKKITGGQGVVRLNDVMDLLKKQAAMLEFLYDHVVQVQEKTDTPEASNRKKTESISLSKIRVIANVYKKAFGEDSLRDVFLEYGADPEKTTAKMLSSIDPAKYPGLIKSLDEKPPSKEKTIMHGEVLEALDELKKKKRKKIIKEFNMDIEKMNNEEYDEQFLFEVMSKITGK